jgi:putative heme-binding domain-containing protein
MFELKDDDVVVSGNIVSEDETSVTIQTGATAAQSQKIPKSNIESRRPSTVSIMPAGLLNTLDKEQILDLVAYLVANGDAKAPAFQAKP